MAIKKTTKKTDVNAFIQRKLSVLNAHGGYKAEKAMTRVIGKNKGGQA